MFAVVGISFIGILLLLLLIPFALAIMAFWIWMLVDAILNKGLSDGEKIGWVIAIVFLHFIGSLLYFFIGRPKGKILQPVNPPVMPQRS